MSNCLLNKNYNLIKTILLHITIIVKYSKGYVYEFLDWKKQSWLLRNNISILIRGIN